MSNVPVFKMLPVDVVAPHHNQISFAINEMDFSCTGIVCECIHTIASIECSTELIELSLTSITSLLKSQNSNLKYMGKVFVRNKPCYFVHYAWAWQIGNNLLLKGLEALTVMITKVKSCFATKHQPAVIECLHHPDISIRLKVSAFAFNQSVDLVFLYLFLCR